MELLKLQKTLGERIEVAGNKELTAEQRKEENDRSDMIVRLAKQMINNADVILRADKLIAEGKAKNTFIEKLIKE